MSVWCRLLNAAPAILLAATFPACHARPAAMAESADADTLVDLAYGSDPAQQLDVYRPKDARQAPLILMVHGGAWRIGDKRSRAVVENKVARWLPKGFIFVSVNNRLLPDAGPLEQAADVARALAYVQRTAPSWGGDPERIVLMGHSAGAHLVSLLSADPDKAYRHGAKRWLGSVALDSAAYDMTAIMQTDHYRFYDQPFGDDPAYWKAASPLQVLSRDARPILAVCSSERKDRPCDQAGEFVRQAKTLGVRAELSPQPMSHREINQDLGLANDETEVVEAFMASLDSRIRRRLSR